MPLLLDAIIEARLNGDKAKEDALANASIAVFNSAINTNKHTGLEIIEFSQSVFIIYRNPNTPPIEG